MLASNALDPSTTSNDAWMDLKMGIGYCETVLRSDNKFVLLGFWEWVLQQKVTIVKQLPVESFPAISNAIYQYVPRAFQKTEYRVKRSTHRSIWSLSSLDSSITGWQSKSKQSTASRAPTQLSCLYPQPNSTCPSTQEITSTTREMKRIWVLTTTAGIRELMQYLHFQLEQTDFHSLHVYSLLLSALSAANVITMKLVSFSFVDVGIAELAWYPVCQSCH